MSRELFVYTIITSLVIFAINKRGLSRQYEIYRRAKKSREKRTSLTSELVRGIRDIKALNATTPILHQTKRRVEDALNEEYHMMGVRTGYALCEGIVRSLSGLFFIVLGIVLYRHNLLTIPAFVVVYNYKAKLSSLLNGFVQIAELNRSFTVSSDRVYEVIDNTKFAKEKFGDVKLVRLNGHIRFDNVTFGYNSEHKIIDGMNFEVKPNQKVAFVGRSGVGKTTIFNLITRMYHADSGQVMLDGHNIETLDQASIRNNMSIITQSPYIFNFTIKENLRIAKNDASLKEIRQACKLACIDDYIMSLPDKYDTMVGENGVILSGGQRQRLAIARALLKKTEIILLDEATSALDNETQSQIQRAIDNLQGEYTILIVAHRLSTVVDSDRIFVVDDGRVIDSGTHDELLKTCQLYCDLYAKDVKV